MADVHQMIIQNGIEHSRRFAATKHERRQVEAAYQVLSEDADRMGFAHSGFALTSLPHKPPTESVWRRQGYNCTLVLQSGTDENGKMVGLPYGSYARFILLFLQSEAIRTQCREIELGRSMRIWLTNMGLSVGGKTYRLVTEQARRISACSLVFFTERSGFQQRTNAAFVKRSEILMENVIDDHPRLWQDRVILDDEFFQELRDHPVPLSESALQAIGPRSMALDIYVFLAYRLHSLRQDADVGWMGLHAQFGTGYKLVRQFRAHFIEALEMALAAYPKANVIIRDAGVTLQPSPPAVAKIGYAD